MANRQKPTPQGQALPAIHSREGGQDEQTQTGDGRQWHGRGAPLEESCSLAPDAYHVTVFGAEPHPNYNRILLSPVLAGEQTPTKSSSTRCPGTEEHGVTPHLNRKVTRIDRQRRVVIADDGTEAEYDRLLLATGSNLFILPIPGKDLDGVIGLSRHPRHQCMIDAAARYRHAVVIGGGLLAWRPPTA